MIEKILGGGGLGSRAAYLLYVSGYPGPSNAKFTNQMTFFTLGQHPISSSQ